MNIDQMRTKFGNTVADKLHETLGLILKQEGKSAIPPCIHLCLNTALCAIVPAVPFYVKRPKMSEEEFNNGGAEMLSKLINYETILFGSLVAARMHSGNAVVAKDAGEDAMTKHIEMRQDVEFGLQTLADALEDWKKLTGKNPADYLDDGLLKAVQALQMEAAEPLDAFLKKRLEAQGPTPSSGTLQ